MCLITFMELYQKKEIMIYYIIGLCTNNICSKTKHEYISKGFIYKLFLQEDGP